MPFVHDAGSFYITIYGGLVIGLLFDLYRALRISFKCMNYISIILEVLLWVTITGVIFVTINSVENFNLRYYHFVALILGFILYYNTISKYVLKVISSILLFIVNLFKKLKYCTVSILNNLYYVIIYSLHFLFDIIFYIPNFFLYGKKRFGKVLKVKKIRRKV